MRTAYWGPIAGIIFAIFFIVGLSMLGLPVGGEASDEATIRAFYEDAANRQRIVIVAYVLAIAGLAFIVFLSDLLTRLPGPDVPPSPLSNIVRISGVIFVAMLFGGSTALVSLGAGMALGGEPATLGDVGVARFTAHIGYGMITLYGAFAAALMLVATALLGLRTKALPSWLNWFGIAAAVILLAGVIFIPIVILPVWVLAASIAFLLRR